MHEDFIGMHPSERTNADQVVAIVKNSLLRIIANIKRVRGQCYDRAATKGSEKTGVVTQIKTINGKCSTRTVMDMPQIWLSLMQ